MAPEPDGACLGEDELCALADGSAAPEARASADRHLDGCEDCRRVLAALAHEEESPRDDETPTVPAQRLGVTLPADLASRYVPLREMGDSSLYAAYVARDRAHDELVGLKWIRGDWATQPGVGQRLRAALTRARAIDSLNVVRPRECHEEDGTLLWVEDLVASDDLAALLRARGIGPELAQDVVTQLLGALAAAHRAGAPHGHLRTENVLVDLAGHVHVADFGLANALQGRALTDAELVLDDTQTAARLGLTLLERCGGGAPAVIAILESALERPDGFPSAVELADAVERAALEHRALRDQRSVGRDREWIPAAGAIIAGKYQVEGLLGRGGMAAVMTAIEQSTGRRVALKLMPPRATKSRAAVERFLREGRAASAVASEHVVRVLEVGQSDEGVPFIVMEQLEGVTLGRLLKKRGALPVAEALHYVLQACVAVAECHAMGIVHRDLKPENVLIDRYRRWRITDFGIAKGDDESAGATGTPAFAAPEQLLGETQDQSVDCFAIGGIIVFALTGKPPFSGSDAKVILAQQLAGDFGAERFEPPVRRFLERALTADVAKRYPDAAAMRAAWRELRYQMNELERPRQHWLKRILRSESS